MINKIILFFFLLIVSSSFPCFAQSEPADIGSVLLGFATKLNKGIDSFFQRKDAERAYRLIGYFRTDLDSYLQVRRSFLDSIKTWDYKSKNDNLEVMSSKLKNSVDKLKTRVSDLIPIINDDLGDDAEYIVREINGQVSTQQNYVSNLQLLINGTTKSVNKSDIINQGEKIQQQLTKALRTMASIRTKLKNKFKL